MDVSPNVWCVLPLAILQPWMVLSVSCKYNEIRIVAIQPKQYNDINHHILELYRYNPTELQSYVLNHNIEVFNILVNFGNPICTQIQYPSISDRLSPDGWQQYVLSDKNGCWIDQRHFHSDGKAVYEELTFSMTTCHEDSYILDREK